jgi:phospholipase C
MDTTPEPLFQEPGLRRSRALPYELHVEARAEHGASKLGLTFRNTGSIGAVVHVYDRLHLDRIPRRYTVEAGKVLTDDWKLGETNGRYDLWVYGTNSFLREFRGTLQTNAHAPEVDLQYDVSARAVRVIATNRGDDKVTLTVCAPLKAALPRMRGSENARTMCSDLYAELAIRNTALHVPCR